MKPGIYTLLPMLLAGVLFTPFCMAQDPSMAGEYPESGQSGERYGTTVGRKLGSGLSNMAMGWIEIPKNTLNVTNDPDTKYALFGLVGGIIKGTLHAVGRTLTGAGDFVTVPLPTKPMIRADYVWDDFNSDTTYGPYFQPDPSSNAE
ncbi:MAG: exosortase system-associated protein, TIGR04073 family [Methylococcales bacterium]